LEAPPKSKTLKSGSSPKVTPSVTTVRKPPPKLKNSKETDSTSIYQVAATKGESPTKSNKNAPPKSKAGTPCSEGMQNRHQDGMANKFFPVKLRAMAQDAWKERYGKTLPPMYPFGDSYKMIGTVWTQSICEPGKSPLYTTTECPPSVLDDSFKTLPNQEGVAFCTQNKARDALYWWIICTVPSLPSRRRWANELLGNHESMVLVVAVYSHAWCTLFRHSNGSFCIEYNGRKWGLA